MKQDFGSNEDSKRGLSWRQKLVGAAVLGGMGITGSCVGYGSFFTYIKPNEVAIKQSKMFGEGIEQRVFPGGNVYFTAPGTTFNRFPNDWQVLEYNSFAQALEETVSGMNVEGPIRIQSTDGFVNTFEITIIYRISDALKLINGKIGTGKGFEVYVKSQSDTVLNKALGGMAAEDLYDVSKRKTHVDDAVVKLNERLNPVGIEVAEVLVRRFEYNPEYEKRIQAKVLQAQLEITNREGRKAEGMRADVSKIEAEGQASRDTELTRGRTDALRIKAEADAYRDTKNAEANLLIKKAEAGGQDLINRAYEGGGAENIVGVKMAQTTASAIKRVYVKSCREDGANPLDLGAIPRKLTGRK